MVGIAEGLVTLTTSVVRVCVGIDHVIFFFFFNDTATTEIYTLSLHDALPIYIWLSFLEDSTVMIEKQLLPICIQVFRLTNVNGELVTFAIQSIIEAIQSQLSPSEQALFHASSHGIERLFIDAYAKTNQVDLLRKQLQTTQYLDSVSYTWQSN